MISILPGCKDSGIEVPPDIPIAQLLQAPDTISADGKRLYLTTFMWRDFMPISPPDGKPLIAIAYVTTADTTQIPTSISADAIWIVYDAQAWRSFFTGEMITPDLQRPYRIVRIARDGPKWGPNIYVDVIVRVFDINGNAQLLHAPNQWIGRTD